MSTGEPPAAELTQALSITYRRCALSAAEIPVQHPNTPYNQQNEQFDGCAWSLLTGLNYTEESRESHAPAGSHGVSAVQS
jgi:hypothetical protein